MLVEEDYYDYLAHYGTLHKSGRYPWGSKNNEPSEDAAFLDYIQDARKKGLTEKQIAEGIGLSMNEVRNLKTVARAKIKQQNIAQAEKLRAKGYSHEAIGKAIAGKNGKPIAESVIRSWLAPGVKEKNNILLATADMLKSHVDEKGVIDIGKGVEHHVNVTSTKLRAAAKVLEHEGYNIYRVKIKQQGTGKLTDTRVLAKPGITQKEVWMDQTMIKQINDYSDDGGRSWFGLHAPLPISPRRVAVRYKEDGGGEADGVIYVRPGVDDVSLGGSNYAQVRIQVGKDRYLKGMAMYSNDLPDGVDLLFNTVKSKADVKSDKEAMKKLVMDPNDPTKPDPDNPFGAVIKSGGQQLATRRDGTKRVTSVMNILQEEGDWQGWSKTLSSQMLSKQSPRLVKSQLDMTYDNRKREFDEINALTNPTIKKKLLESFASDVDSAAVHLKAAAINSQQRYHVILPVQSLPDNEVYAPNYKNGDRVVLIRHPHGGTFEIPELIVNNNHPEAKRLLTENPRDAIGINAAVAERLSGADFDGDTVVVIPNNDGKVLSTPALEGLKDFDPRSQYKGYEGMPGIDTQMQMGLISNLITDMTIQGAPPEDLVRAIRHSMVVIDAEKHELDYRQSAIDNGIRNLKQKYQAAGGASTLISRAGAVLYVPERKERLASEGGPVDPKTGKKMYTETGRIKPEGTPRLTRTKRLAEAEDAHTLVSEANTPVERHYADYSNKLKAMANAARKEELSTKAPPKSASAAKVYATEVARLSAALKVAESNAPQERAAQVMAGAVYKAKLAENPAMDDEIKKRVKYQALNEARNRMGAGKERITISPREWEAIQAGAISPSRLRDIIDNSDIDVVKTLATPRHQRVVTSAKLARAQAMLSSGATRAEVAAALGIPLGTLDEALYQ